MALLCPQVFTSGDTHGAYLGPINVGYLELFVGLPSKTGQEWICAEQVAVGKKTKTFGMIKNPEHNMFDLFLSWFLWHVNVNKNKTSYLMTEDDNESSDKKSSFITHSWFCYLNSQQLGHIFLKPFSRAHENPATVSDIFHTRFII